MVWLGEYLTVCPMPPCLAAARCQMSAGTFPCLPHSPRARGQGPEGMEKTHSHLLSQTMRGTWLCLFSLLA